MLHLLSSPWIALSVLTGIAASARIMSGSWLHPSAFPGLVWSVFIFLALVVAPEYEVGGFGVWIIVALNTATYIGAFLVPGRVDLSGATRMTAPLPISRWIGWVVAFSSLALVGAVLFGAISLSDNGQSASFSGLVALGHVVSVARYSGVKEPAIVRALWMWVFPAAVLGGITFVLGRNRFQKVLSLSPFVPAFAFSLVETTRGGFIIAMCCWLGAFLATKVCSTGGNYRPFNLRALVVTGLLALVVCSVFVGFDAIRVFTPGHMLEMEANYPRMKAYFVGSLCFFDRWMDQEQNSENLTLGTETFRSLAEFAGLRTWQINPVLMLEGGGETNIPTAFRGLIQDFTFPGALFICLVFGYTSGVAFEKTKQGQSSQLSLLAAYYSLYLFSPIIALTAYNGPILGWISVAFLLRSRTRIVCLEHFRQCT